MRTVEEYESWALPLLLQDPAYKDLINAMFAEIVELQKYNMGSYNGVGLNTVEESIKFSTPDQWTVCSEFNALRAKYVPVQDGFIFSGETLIYTQHPDDRFAVYNYAFVVGNRYRVQFEIYDVDIIDSGFEIVLGLGHIVQFSQTLVDGETYLIDIELEAKDYWFYFGVESGPLASFKIRNFTITGVEEFSDDTERILVLRRITAIDNAGRFILERMRDSLTFPSIANTPEELLRQLVQDYNYFISYKGSELLSIMFFYFLGYAVDFIYLYARIGDYESNNFPYLQEKEDDLLISSRPSNILGEASMTQYNTQVLTLKPGHQIIAGDKIGNQDNPFPQVLVEVLQVDGDLIYLAEAVTVNYDGGPEEGDLLDIFREYPYSVNPDTDNYFKTSHMDIFFRQKYLSGVDINFNSLQGFLERYLPINVVIRFFGFETDVSDEVFQITEPLFQIGLADDDELEIEEETVIPSDAFIYLVVDELPATHLDEEGTPVDGYSYNIVEYDIYGEPVYAVID